jgi:CelD/BcsL family acetyltransferase involved in cellulose biosynthesis
MVGAPSSAYIDQTEMSFAIETYRSFVPVASEWDELATRVGAPPFLRPGWIEIWWRAFGRGVLEIVVARADGRLVAVLPLMRRSFSARSPTNWHSPVFGPVYAEEDATPALIRSLLRSRSSWLDISLLDAEDPFARKLPEVAESLNARVAVRSVLRSPYIELEGDWQSFEASLGKEFRRQTRKHWRRLEREGAAKVVFTAGEDRLDDLLSEGFAIEGSGWKDDAGTAIRSQPATERFYREIGHWAAERGWLQLGFLRLDGRCTAFYFSLVEGDSLYALKTGFDSKFAAFGPGTLMARAAIERSFADGLARFEFLGSDQRYKLHWTSTVHERVRVQAFPRSLSGTAGFVGWAHARPVAKRARDVVMRRRALAR